MRLALLDQPVNGVVLLGGGMTETIGGFGEIAVGIVFQVGDGGCSKDQTGSQGECNSCSD